MTPNKKKRMFHQQKGKCFYCGCDMKLPEGRAQYSNTATVEHLIPQSYYRNKPDHEQKFENTALACHSCNGGRGCMPIKQFVTQLHGKLH